MTKEEIVQALRVCGAMLEQIGRELQLVEGDSYSVMAYAADLIEANAAEIEKLKAKVPRWIPVTERLPEQDVPVLAWFEDGLISRQSPDIVLGMDTNGCTGTCIGTFAESRTGCRCRGWRHEGLHSR